MALAKMPRYHCERARRGRKGKEGASVELVPLSVEALRQRLDR